MAQKIVIDFEARYKEAAFDIETLNKQVVKLEKAIESSNKEAKKTTQNFDDIKGVADKATGGAISGFTGMAKTLKGVVTGLKTMRGALIATGLGALVVLLGSIVAAFTTTEEGANKFNKILGQIGVVTGNVMDVLTEFGNGILSLGSVFTKVFAGDFSGAIDAVGDAFAGFTDKVSNFAEETAKELEIAAQISGILKQAQEDERKLKVERAQADQDRARLLEQAVDKERYNTQERISFLQQASQIEQDITNKEIELAQKKLEAQILQNGLSGSQTANLEAQAELEATVIALETARLAKQKEVTSQILGLNNEAAAARKAEIDAMQAQADEFTKINQDRNKKVAADDKKTQEATLKASVDGMNKVLVAKVVANNQELKNQELLEQAKQENIAAGIQGAVALLGENSKFAKGIAIVSAIRDTYAGATKALAQGGIFGAIGAAGIIASGLANVKQIVATQDPEAPAGVAISGGRGSVAVPNIQAPDFNIVGSSGTNQLAQAIGGKVNEPVKAYVVSNDVSTAQSLDRNIVKGASL
jgi:hypothetical protein